MWSRFCAQSLKKKILDEEQLLHSEWNRRLGAFSLAGIGGVLSLGTTLFIILPGIFSSGSIAPPLPSVLIGVFVNFFVAKQLSAISRILPRNCLLYELAYATHSESLAFIIGWSQLVDSLAFIVVIAHSLSDHVFLLFSSASQSQFYKGQGGSSFVHQETNSFFSLDILSVIAVIISGLILCCSLRVLATITIVLLISSLFTVTSTTVVAILHNMQQLRITSLGFPYEFDQVCFEIQWIFIGILSLEAFSYISEETEQPRKILPKFFPSLSKSTSVFFIVSVIAFFPFTQRLNFDGKSLLPNVFNSISIYSARYLMSVGAVCALTGALLASLIPSSRLLYSMAKDGLLPFSKSMFKLNGKGGSPRSAVIFTAVSSCFLTVIPRNFLLMFLSIDICMRIFCQSLLLYQVCFSPDIVGLSKVAPKYSKLKRNTTGLTEGASMDGYSCISSDEHDPDDEIITHLCELHNRQNSEWSAVLDSASEARYQNYLAIDANQNEQQIQKAPEIHNCLQTSCGDGQIQENQKGFLQYHIYEAEIENSPFFIQKSDGRGKEPFLNPEIALRTAMRYLTGFTVASVFCSVSYKGL
ncbi:hypothetical protein FO519_004923 [Halicephalobus sp. NKZ332]|nr:hypothetical protein FO519_004923 [Halicephalobus sp. NKZ332]